MGRTERENLSYGTAALALTLGLMLLWPGLLKNLLAANGFMPHGHCYLWKPALVWLHLSSDSLIAVAYAGISATLAYLVYKTRQEIPFHWMFMAFGTFILACGGTHFMEVLTLWNPVYWLAGAMKLITAVASVTTAAVLPPLVPRALALVEAAKLSEERRLDLETANRELGTLYGKLKELDDLKTQFFANVSHELRTPLALILGPTEKLLAAGGLTEEQRRDLQVVERNARLLLKHVSDLLDISKLEEGKMGLAPADTDLAQLVRLCAANFEGVAAERQISFAVETPESLPCRLDAGKIQRAVLNLLSNAFKFTPEGGSVRCALSAGPNPLAGSGIAIAVSDSGPGVPAPLREMIFQRFRQGEEGATRRFGGTGLGLAIVKDFVELHAGTVSVGDAPEGGAIFTVELPLIAPSEAISPARVAEFLNTEEVALPLVEQLSNFTGVSAATEQQQGDRPLVLVVEDNPEMSRFVAETLARSCRTATASDGEEGLRQALALRPDLIVTDVMMPRMSGDELVRQIRIHPQLDCTPVVVLTAKTEDELRVRLLREGAQDFLMKPFSVEELRARTGNLIAIKRSRDLLRRELASQSQDLEALAGEVARRRRELQIALAAQQKQAEELQRVNRLKDEFLAVVSHELRTPLNSILGWAQLIRSQKKLSPEAAIKGLETIERNAKQQVRLIDDILDVSRIIRGKLRLHIVPVNFGSIVDEAIETLLPAARAKNIEIVKTFRETSAATALSSGPVSGDPNRLQQVVWNLLSNAVKFTPEGGRVEIEVERTGSALQLLVRDTGIGITPEFLPHVFEGFRQADSSTTRSYGGLGLGLTVARYLVGLHGGTVEAFSEGEGKGATFTVKLPAAGVASPQTQPEAGGESKLPVTDLLNIA